MAVLCELGLHKPAPWPRWNVGYYFTKCERCSADLVRTAYGNWHVPRGFRVRWQATPPEGADLQAGLVDLEPHELPAAAPPEQPAAADPTEAAPEPEVDESLEQPAPAEVETPPPAAEPPAPPPAPAPPPRPASRIPDFMSDGSDQGAAQALPPEPTAATRPPLIPPRASDQDEPEQPRRPLLPMLLRPQAAATDAPAGEAGQPHSAPVIGFFMFVIVVALALALVRWPSMRGAPSAPGPAAGSQAPASPAQLPQSAFRVAVEASLLNCRAAPAPEAAVLQRLGSGETVQLIERGAEWANVDTGRRQCWVLEQYLSAPLDL